MTVVVTRNVRERFRGFLASVMCEIAPGTYTAPRMTRAARERVWGVLTGWWAHGEEASIVMTWPDSKLPGGQEVRVLGQVVRCEVVEHDGVYLTRGELTKEERARVGMPEGEPPPF